MNNIFQVDLKKTIRQQNLFRILSGKYIPSEELNHQFDTAALKGSLFENVFIESYRSLGGIAVYPEIKFTAPLLEFGRFCVILDESIHFNRYRAKTLRASFYENLTSFPLIKYRSYCRKYEVECIKVGTSNSVWTNDEAERHFGPSQQSGDLGLNGSSGWKFTAFKDFATDLIARQRKIRLIRIAVWDDLMINQNLKKFHELLMSPGKTESGLIQNYTEKKLIGLYADDF